MTRRYTTTLSLSIGGDVPTWEGEATVTYAVTWGAPERGPTYACGGTPADPDDVDDIKVTHIDDVPVWDRLHGDHEAQTIVSHIEGNDLLMLDLLAHASESEAADRADAEDCAAERRAEAPDHE